MISNFRITSQLVSELLKCPVCGNDMYTDEYCKSAFCNGAKKHCFDFSSEGYLSMSGKGGDPKQMVNARRTFLQSDYYLPAANKMREVMNEYSRSITLVDAGCGEGYFTSKFAGDFQYSIGFDLSKYACACGAKYAGRNGIESLLYITASVFKLPVKDCIADCVTNIFAPCAEDEFTRILKPGGILILAGAGKNHLSGLKKAIYDNTYSNGERNDLPQNMIFEGKTQISFDIDIVGNDNIKNLFSMTPYYWRTSESDSARLDRLDRLETEVEFDIYVYRSKLERK